MRTGDVGQEHTVSTPFEPSAGLDALFVAFRDEKAYTLRVKDRGVELVTFDFAAKIDAIVGRREFHAGDDKRALAPVDDHDRLPAGASFEEPSTVEEATITTLVRAGQRAAVDRFGLLLIEEAG